LKKALRGKIFVSADDVREDVQNFLDGQDENFYKSAFAELVTRWEKCVTNNGFCVEK
jgi:hypothetical protein